MPNNLTILRSVLLYKSIDSKRLDIKPIVGYRWWPAEAVARGIPSNSSALVGKGSRVLIAVRVDLVTHAIITSVAATTWMGNN